MNDFVNLKKEEKDFYTLYLFYKHAYEHLLGIVNKSQKEFYNDILLASVQFNSNAERVLKKHNEYINELDINELEYQNEFDSIENLCGYSSSLFNDYVKELISAGINKTGEKIWVIKKHKKTNKILHEKYFELYEVHPSKNFKIKFFIHHDKENIPRIIFEGTKSMFDVDDRSNIRYDKNDKTFVFEIEYKNSQGNYYVKRNYKDYEDYYNNLIHE